MRKLTFVRESLQVPKYVGSGVSLLFGAALMDDMLVLSLALFAFAIYLPMSFTGVEIVPQLKRYRIFKSHFGARNGSWENLGRFKAIIILARQGKKGLVSPYLVTSIDAEEVLYHVFLANEVHRKKLLVKTFDSYSAAREFALSLASELKLPVEKYNPRIPKEIWRRIRQRRFQQRK